MLNQTIWLLVRAVLAIVLMVGFYVLAIVVIGVLLWIPYAEIAYLHVFSLKLSLACLAGALAIFVAILPRRDVFEPPGPAVTELDEPRLFAFIRGVAGDMKQKMPADVYVVGDANAWVTHRGGVMGIGSRRVMGLGLPLLQALPVAELRAVLAHEFGHFASSDVILGPWIHKTHGAIRRTLLDVGHFVVFKWYGTLFLRVTHAISRRQELVADRLAARAAGASVLARALRRTSTLGPAYQAYFQNDVAPVVRAGFLPPVVQGFDRFLRGVLTRQMTDDVRTLIEAETAAEAFDSHPTLRERVTALGCADDEAPSADIGAPASSLLDHAENYTTRLLQRAIGEERLQALRPIAWDDVGQSIYVERWRSNSVACAPVLAPLTFETLPTTRKDIEAIAQAWKVKAPLEARIALVTGGMQCALATRLVIDGWHPDVRPGEPLVFVKGEERCHPFALLNDLFAGKTTREHWLAQCSVLKVSGPLVDAQAALAAAEPAQEGPPPPPNRSTRRRRGW